MVRCRICGERASLLWSFIWVPKDPHTRTAHPDFVNWYRRFVKTYAIVTLITLWTLVVLNRLYLVRLVNPFLAEASFFVAVLTPAEVVVVFVLYFAKLYRFKREWRNNHSGEIESGSLLQAGP